MLGKYYKIYKDSKSGDFILSNGNSLIHLTGEKKGILFKPDDSNTKNLEIFNGDVKLKSSGEYKFYKSKNGGFYFKNSVIFIYISHITGKLTLIPEKDMGMSGVQYLDKCILRNN